ncbi:MAG: phospho-N-acetylmuramoyl-pentapeptide-transferase [Deltaproteobacteria bacterium]|nr:phospho-N-acetylmuramoyl-pentapeptide-transferase [Deltaproteobacteria bacterium]
MIYLLSEWLRQALPELSFLRLVTYLSFRSIMAALTSLFFMFLAARLFLNYLHRRQLVDLSRETGLGSSKDKRGTPTLGGVLILGAVLLSVLLWGRLSSGYVLLTLAAMVWFGLIGLLDDLAKIGRRSGDKGLSERTKFILQGVFALGFGWIMLSPLSPLPGEIQTQLYVPFYKKPLVDLGPVLYFLFIVFFVLFVSNSVNITDGLDGLAIMPSNFVVAILGVFAYIMGNKIQAGYLFYPYLPGAGELNILCAAFMGAGLGFLWYNAYPAQIFMGDTGSLGIGAIIAALSVLLKQELLFPILGGIFLVEGFTSQVQDKIGVRWLGRRIFYRAPIHHELQYRGLAETKVVIRIWIISGILALIALATIKIR